MLGCLRHKNLTWFSFKDGAVQILSESWFLITYPMEASAIFSTETPIRRESCHGSKDWISFGGLLPLWLIWMKNVRGKSFKEMFRLAIYCLMQSSMLSLGIGVWQKFSHTVRIQEKLLYRQEQWDIPHLSIFIRVFPLRRQMFTALVW